MADLSLKPQKSLAEKLSLLDKIADNINKKAGKKIVGRIGNDPELMERLKIEFIPTPSFNVNAATGGGFPRRRTTIIAGLPDSGKTSLALETIAMNMKRDPNFVAAWLESENSLEKDYICKTFGIDPERFFYIEHEREGAGEKALDLVEAVLATGSIDMMVINSLKCLVPSEEYKKSHCEAVVGLQARLNARMMRKFTALVAESNAAFVIITHLSTDIGSYSRDPMVISGGHAILHGASLILDMRKKSITDADPIDKEEGIKIGVTVKKNHCVPDRNPYVKTDYYAIFGQGIEQYLTTLELAIEQGILKRSGAWIYEYNPDGTIKNSFQGKEKYRQYCIENPEWFNNLQKLVQGEIVQLTEEEIEEIKAEEEALGEIHEKEMKRAERTKSKKTA